MAAFSNGSEFETFMWNNCYGQEKPGRACYHDRNEDCPLLAQALSLESTPDEWKPNGHMSRYDCQKYETEVQAEKRLEAERRAEADAMHYPMFEEL